MNIRNEYKDGVIQIRRWENLLDFSTVFSGWFTPAVERACERTVSPRYLTRGHKKQETIYTTKRKTLYLQGKTAFYMV